MKIQKLKTTFENRFQNLLLKTNSALQKIIYNNIVMQKLKERLE